MYNIINASSYATRTLHPSPVTQEELNTPLMKPKNLSGSVLEQKWFTKYIDKLGYTKLLRKYSQVLLMYCQYIFVPQEFAEACSFDDLVKFNSSLNERVISFNLFHNKFGVT